ncbi:hypothetical protein [Hymenobacter persicinus]|uniref:Uncharacterized protein n=1 Tax=Hymenobacter persicinus TaxID=2025506 RepID=A0A4Q5LBN1_9BACT|nr:hypothetical protein [Hymenobacter persicinus]RYU79910.1 hypothetical protein EWM57_09500 [Hymenobacter persicinus]
MTNSIITFSAAYDDGLGIFDVTIRHRAIEAHMHFYGEPDAWNQFGKQLLSFPRSAVDCVTFEAGSNAQDQDFLILQAYCYNAGGHSALKVVVADNHNDPSRYRLEFSIPAEPASLNKLGRLLSGWQIENNSEIVWEAQVS